MRTPSSRVLQWIGLALLLLGWLAYRPGLSGGFLFDDFVNLDALGNSGPVDNWRTFWRFITSGTADPTGRPLALLSFLLDAHDWPADPASFLRTNLLIHLLNGALLFVLLRRLGRALVAPQACNDATALLAAAMWMLHPLFVSTTLYVIQREAMLPASFLLLGLLAYDRGRRLLAAGSGRKGLIWMLGGIGGGTVVAVLCKGNGILLPLLGWVLEATVYRASDVALFRDDTTRRQLARTKWLLLILPSVLLFLYVGHFALAWNAPIATRPWTIGQRLLTEPRVLVDYLQLLLVPRSVSSGLYNDGYVVSTSLLHPASTLPAMLAIIGLVYAAIRYRARWPLCAAAVLYFFAAHLLESSTLALELYFEHRNYVPAMLLAWPLAFAICRSRFTLPVRFSIAIALLALLAATTYQRCILWGDQAQLADLWARQNPGSSRAQATAAIADLRAGRPDRALARLDPIRRAHPHDLQIAFNWIDATCAVSGLNDADKLALADALRESKDAPLLMYNWLGGSIEVAHAGNCPGLTLADLQAWLDAALENPLFNNPHVRDQDIEPLLGQLAMRRDDPAMALQHFDRALAATPRPDVAARQASMLAASGAYEQALAHLETYERLKGSLPPPGPGMPWLHAKVLAWEGYWPFEMALLRSKLHAAIADRDAAPPQSRQAGKDAGGDN